MNFNKQNFENALKDKLLKRLPKKYREAVRDLTAEDGLIDGCKYMLSWTDEYTNWGEEERGFCFPVRSIAEAADYVRNVLYKLPKKED